MNILFVCNQNKHRSKTAEHLFKDKCTTRSAGLYSKRPLTAEELAWADLVLVMEEEQRSEIGRRFPKQYMQKRILSLDIPDAYLYNQQKLIDLLQERMKRIELLH